MCIPLLETYKFSPFDPTCAFIRANMGHIKIEGEPVFKVDDGDKEKDKSNDSDDSCIRLEDAETETDYDALRRAQEEQEARYLQALKKSNLSIFAPQFPILSSSTTTAARIEMVVIDNKNEDESESDLKVKEKRVQQQEEKTRAINEVCVIPLDVGLPNGQLIRINQIKLHAVDNIVLLLKEWSDLCVPELRSKIVVKLF